MDVTLTATRFTVYSHGDRLGVVVPRNDGWAFVPCNGNFQVFFGVTPEDAIAEAGMFVKH